MPIIRVRETESLEHVIRRFKRTCEKAGTLSELRHREYYEKPTEKRKRKKAAAIKRHMKKIQKEQQMMEQRRKERERG